MRGQRTMTIGLEPGGMGLTRDDCEDGRQGDIDMKHQ